MMFMTPYKYFINDLEGRKTIGAWFSDGSTETVGRVEVPQTLTDELLQDIIDIINNSLDIEIVFEGLFVDSDPKEYNDGLGSLEFGTPRFDSYSKVIDWHTHNEGESSTLIKVSRYIKFNDGQLVHLEDLPVAEDDDKEAK